jgi:MerR family transcriptional regulator, light-induced transcriptional regulator
MNQEQEAGPKTPRHPIRVVAQRTGLTTDVLRAWEKRYGVVEPGRSETGHRLYSDEDVERLSLLRRATEAGRAIGGIANLDLSALAAVVREDDAHRRAAERQRITAAGDAASEHVSAALRAIHDLDAAELDGVLVRAALRLGSRSFLEKVAIPMLKEVGDAWHEERLGIANEHMASTATQRVLGWLLWSGTPNRDGPVLVVGTPAGQRHEMGALMSAAVAAEEGWRVVYLGPDLPVDEVARVAVTREANAIALSVIYPPDEPRVVEQLRKLRALRPDTPLLVGGAAAGSYTAVLKEIGAIVLPELNALRERLATLRPEYASRY